MNKPWVKSDSNTVMWPPNTTNKSGTTTTVSVTMGNTGHTIVPTLNVSRRPIKATNSFAPDERKKSEVHHSRQPCHGRGQRPHVA